MAAVTLEDRNRRDINFNQAQVDTLLPEHFQEQYPTLVTFLKKYYGYFFSKFFQDNKVIIHYSIYQ
jgi:hypothetical protein